MLPIIYAANRSIANVYRYYRDEAVFVFKNLKTRGFGCVLKIIVLEHLKTIKSVVALVFIAPCELVTDKITIQKMNGIVEMFSTLSNEWKKERIYILE